MERWMSICFRFAVDAVMYLGFILGVATFLFGVLGLFLGANTTQLTSIGTLSVSLFALWFTAASLAKLFDLLERITIALER